MLTTNNHELAARAALFRNSGVTREKSLLEDKTQEDWYYEQQSLGCNYRLTDIQAALGKSQLVRLDSFIAKRLQISQRYQELLEGLPLLLPQSDKRGAWHLYPVQLANACPSVTRDLLFRHLRDRGIGVNVHYRPIHLQPYYRALGFAAGDFPGAELFGQRVLSLPIHARLAVDEQDYVVNTLRDFFA